MSMSKRFGAVAAVLGLAAVGTAALPGSADAWWARGGCCWGGGVGFGVVLPPVFVAPPPVYVAPPIAYAPPPPPVYYGYHPAPQHYWVPGFWRGGYWIPGHWS
jgi:hypothetical protein